MDILRVWIAPGEDTEKARLYKNIDPESICIIGHRVYFAHVGTYTPGKTYNCYNITLENCDFIITNPDMIQEEMKRFNFTGDLGYYNQIANLKEN